MDPHSPLLKHFQAQVCYDIPDFVDCDLSATTNEQQLELDLGDDPDFFAGYTGPVTDDALIAFGVIQPIPEPQSFIARIASKLGL